MAPRTPCASTPHVPPGAVPECVPGCAPEHLFITVREQAGSPLTFVGLLKAKGRIWGFHFISRPLCGAPELHGSGACICASVSL